MEEPSIRTIEEQQEEEEKEEPARPRLPTASIEDAVQQLGDMKPVFAALESRREQDVAQALAVIARTVNGHDGADIVLRYGGGVHAITRAMATAASAANQTTAARIVALLAARNARTCAAFRDVGVMSAVVRLLEQTTEDTPKEAAIEAIESLVASSVENRVAFRRAGGIPLMVNLLWPDSPHQEKATKLLATLTFKVSENARLFANEDGVPLIIPMLQDGGAKGGHHALYLLANVAEYASDQLIELDVMPVLQQRLEENDVTLQRHAARAIAHLCGVNALSRKTATELGVLSVVIRLLSSPEPLVRVSAAHALASVLLDQPSDPTTREAIVPLLRMVKNPHVWAERLGALEALASVLSGENSHILAVFREEGGPEVILPCLDDLCLALEYAQHNSTEDASTSTPTTPHDSPRDSATTTTQQTLAEALDIAAARGPRRMRSGSALIAPFPVKPNPSAALSSSRARSFSVNLSAAVRVPQQATEVQCAAMKLVTVVARQDAATLVRAGVFKPLRIALERTETKCLRPALCALEALLAFDESVEAFACQGCLPALVSASISPKIREEDRTLLLSVHHLVFNVKGVMQMVGQGMLSQAPDVKRTLAHTFDHLMAAGSKYIRSFAEGNGFPLLPRLLLSSVDDDYRRSLSHGISTLAGHDRGRAGLCTTEMIGAIACVLKEDNTSQQVLLHLCTTLVELVADEKRRDCLSSVLPSLVVLLSHETETIALHSWTVLESFCGGEDAKIEEIMKKAPLTSLIALLQKHGRPWERKCAATAICIVRNEDMHLDDTDLSRLHLESLAPLILTPSSSFVHGPIPLSVRKAAARVLGVSLQNDGVRTSTSVFETMRKLATIDLYANPLGYEEEALKSSDFTMFQDIGHTALATLAPLSVGRMKAYLELLHSDRMHTRVRVIRMIETLSAEYTDVLFEAKTIKEMVHFLGQPHLPEMQLSSAAVLLDLTRTQYGKDEMRAFKPLELLLNLQSSKNTTLRTSAQTLFRRLYSGTEVTPIVHDLVPFLSSSKDDIRRQTVEEFKLLAQERHGCEVVCTIVIPIIVLDLLPKTPTEELREPLLDLLRSLACDPNNHPLLRDKLLMAHVTSPLLDWGNPIDVLITAAAIARSLVENDTNFETLNNMPAGFKRLVKILVEGGGTADERVLLELRPTLKLFRKLQKAHRRKCTIA